MQAMLDPSAATCSCTEFPFAGNKCHFQGFHLFKNEDTGDII